MYFRLPFTLHSKWSKRNRSCWRDQCMSVNTPQRFELWLTGLEPVVLPIIRKAQIKVTNGIRTHIRRNHNPLHCQVCHSHNDNGRSRSHIPFRIHWFQVRSICQFCHVALIYLSFQIVRLHSSHFLIIVKDRRVILHFNRNRSGYLYIHDMLPI